MQGRRILRLPCELHGLVYPESVLQMIATANRDGPTAVVTYLMLVERCLDTASTVEGDCDEPSGAVLILNGRVMTVEELGTSLRIDRRRIARELSELQGAGLVEVSEKDGGVRLPRVRDAICRLNHIFRKTPNCVLVAEQPLVSPESPASPAQVVPAAPAAPTPIPAATPVSAPAQTRSEAELEKMKDSRMVTEADFRLFFKQRRSMGQKDATAENEDKFWQYLLAVDFRRMNGERISKTTLPLVWGNWLRYENRDKHETQRIADETLAEQKRKEEAEEAAERLNDMMLRGEKETDWDEE